MLRSLFGGASAPSACAEKAGPLTEVLGATFADRVAGALWGMHIGDALSMPSHWYYGGSGQVMRDYGQISGYVKPKVELSGSIMALSNTGGAGRGSNDGEIIGTVIAHGKKKYWARGRAHHYHCTLDQGENTVDCDLVRLTYKHIAENNGEFSPQKLQNEYVTFMTTPGTYNDCYISTTHRMFFANRERGLPLDRCPDNDGHNVDTTCGLPMSIPVALATAHIPLEDACKEVAKSISVTRNSRPCEQYGGVLADMLRKVLHDKPLSQVLESVGGKQLISGINRADPVVA
eukprot:TRINITY_DN4665_c2_g1_i1.p1 TRINITY_DN4665_c2_g1~~TRINITY_DN4665_c2_g1_i1.p1  ORF type:complete len:289 (+),score=34.11 TRINITY_DN4665_c2_g1_i1:80-946(+)